MKNLLTNRNETYVLARTDLTHGIKSRDHAVRILKKFIDFVDVDMYREKLDQLKPRKDPRESMVIAFEALNEWIGSGNSRVDDNDSFAFNINVLDNLNVYTVPMDYLPILKKIDPALEQMALDITMAFAYYNSMSHPGWEGMALDHDYLVQNIQESMEYLESKNLRDKKEIDSYQKLLDSYDIYEEFYAQRMRPNCPGISDWETALLNLEEKLLDMNIHPDIEFVRRALLALTRLSKDYYSLEFVSQMMTDEYIASLPPEEQEELEMYPIVPAQTYLFVWYGGDEPGRNSDVDEEALGQINSYSGEYGNLTTIGWNSNESLKLSDAIEENSAFEYMLRFNQMCKEYMEMRDKLYYEKEKWEKLIN